MACDEAAVRAIIDTDIADLSPYLAAANVIIGPDGCDLAAKGLDTATLDAICTWLSAHLVTVSDPRVDSTRSSGHAVTFEGATDMRLDSSKFGQHAKLLDPTGCLAALDREDRLPFIFSTTRGDTVDSETQPFVPRGGFGFP